MKFNEYGNPIYNYQDLSDEIASLPVLKSNVIELVEAVENNYRIDSETLSLSIQKDQSLVANVLKLARCSVLASRFRIETITDAISVLGVEKIKDLAVASSFMNNLINKNPYKKGFDWKAFWQHCNAVGIISSILSKYLQKNENERFYTAGLLHDLGKMGAFCLAEEQMLGVASLARKHKISFSQSEYITDSPRHDRLGHAICVNWNLPEYLASTCLFHHVYSRERRPFERDEPINDFIDITIIANHLSKKFEIGYSGHSYVDEPIEEALINLGLNLNALNEIKPTILAELKQVAIFEELPAA